MLLLGLIPGSATHSMKDPFEEIIDTLWRGNDIERGRDRLALLEVRDPQFATSKFPLDVGFLL